MRTKWLVAVFGVLAVVVIGMSAAAALSTQTAAATTSQNTVAVSTATSKSSSSARTGSASGAAAYSMVEVAKHSSASSCWAAINGKVYDLTSWINQHPGGPGPILSLCGTDGSVAFNGQHGGQRRPEQELTSFYIGNLSH